LRDVAWLQEHSDRMLHRLGDLASERTLGLYRRFIDAIPALARRYDRPTGLTLVHGDTHAWNFMLPHAGTGHAKLLDWDAWLHGLGATDLAYMMALYWDREPHQRFRDPLLACYQRELEASGIAGYGLGELRRDYQLAVLLHLRTPVTRYAYGIPTRIWWMQLMRVVQAIEDVGAEELLP
jgi:Ser/Thr protein kinase RdoA (MazF antagonist)